MKKEFLTKINNFARKPSVRGTGFLGVAFVLSMLAAEDAAASMETQLTGIRTMFLEDGVKTGMAVGTVIASVGALCTLGIKAMGIVIFIGVALRYYLDWLNSQNFAEAING
jgi:hypothetical protein